MKITHVLAATLLLAAASARAGNEYVDPNFCYRIVLPDEALHVDASSDGSSVSMDVGGDCARHACIHLLVFASYGKTQAAGGPEDPYARQGWSLRSSTVTRISGTTWRKRTLSKGDATLVEYLAASTRDSTRYFLVATYPHGLHVIAEKTIGQLLASWHLVSECV
jgi:hypothetical protein